MFGTTSAIPRWTIAARCVRCAANAGRDWPSGPPCGCSNAGTDLRARIGRRHGELDVPLRMVDRVTTSVLGIERREPEVLAVLVRDLEDAPIAEPSRRDVLHVVLVSRDVARLASAPIDHKQLLV